MLLLENEIKSKFEEKYPHFIRFTSDPQWEKCLEAALDEVLLSHIIFCNDLFEIPPVKTFLIYYKNYFKKYCDSEKGMDPQMKKSIGAFWGNIFKFMLKDENGNEIYNDQKSTYVGIKEFKVTTATYFFK